MSDNPTCYAENQCAITMRSGRMVHLDNPNPDDIDIQDISHHLAGIARFGGALADERGDPLIYTVAEHSIYVVCAAVEMAPSDWPLERVQQLALAAHLHDGAEAYVGDAISPLKMAMRRAGALITGTSQLSDYDAVEARVDGAIRENFGLRIDDDIRKLVKKADLAVYAAEVEQLRKWGEARFTETAGGKQLYDSRWRGRIRCMTPGSAKCFFGQCFDLICTRPREIRGAVHDMRDLPLNSASSWQMVLLGTPTATQAYQTNILVSTFVRTLAAAEREGIDPRIALRELLVNLGAQHNQAMMLITRSLALQPLVWKAGELRASLKHEDVIGTLAGMTSIIPKD